MRGGLWSSFSEPSAGILTSVEPREIKTFDYAAEVLRSALVLVHERAERAGQAWMMDERGCHTFR